MSQSQPTSQSLEITYSITVPEALSRPSPPPTTAPSSGTLSFPLNTTSSRNEWLSSLEKALGEARGELNEKLSEWKEVMKPFEKVEGTKKKGDGEGQEDDGEEGEEE
ncbi:BZ3500_MvSof-1268-A1-R1_Chr12-1g03662 [Microbotryum saponariae]|uniref:BZ3500_MvSof-1268-A1-R1_Chr12-1g03662 protein n=1 Tax=Microbotryum saponariae TaxID=289078 RepID=A0A2X0M7P2_9BASI|nr:BZ3500_MvSof-1268-A1-R1_Chr12-1g03662 [Microbotryum saponariae]SDA05255.1 BZ3501_MvSof-1269-A2-R1_Chr12-1g03239 [Microbotryum saponariae]